ncbi:hypothetical protein ECZU23_47910 [Escherichia coli]|nr:hypothetical protein ECZU08_32520 [Escherichia coli]GHK96094.1 hypothetical protein ECZU20_08440 [Escherichia coli]GHL16348.1 hypothetical protein ECZU23_47910 [Escherichia coli]
MGNLNETEKWEENIYQLETSDPVLGGADGISNRAPRQLANRTKWLKKKTEEAAQSLAEHVRSRNHPDATLTAKGFTQLSSATNSTSETLAATPKAVKAAYDGSRQGACQPHSPVESDNGSACGFTDGKRHRTTEQRHGQSIRN